MKEIQKLDDRIEVIMTYEGKRYKLNPNGLCYCGKCAFDKVPCSDLPMWEGSQPCADFGGGGFWEEIKEAPVYFDMWLFAEAKGEMK